MGPTWVLSSPGGPHVGPKNFAIWVARPKELMIAIWNCNLWQCHAVFACAGNPIVNTLSEHISMDWITDIRVAAFGGVGTSSHSCCSNVWPKISFSSCCRNWSIWRWFSCYVYGEDGEISYKLWHWPMHYSAVIMSAIASQITGVSIVCSTVCSCAHQRKHQSSMSQVTGGFPSQRASNVENISIWWRHRGIQLSVCVCGHHDIDNGTCNQYSCAFTSLRLSDAYRSMRQ